MMQKTAQKRSILNKIREMANIPGAAVEGFFEPEMKRVMNSLREADDNIRTVLVGQKIGTSTIDVPSDNKSLKDMLKSARSNFNRREYMAGVADLGRFHKRMYDVSNLISKLNLSIDQIHNNFLFQGLGNQDKDYLKNLQEHMSSVAETHSEYLIKSAGIMDFFYNIGTQRGRALAAWEKKYPKVAKDIRDGGSRLLDHAEAVLNNTLSFLKEMAVSRASRKVDSYMDSAHKIQNEYNKFDMGDKGFRSYYTNVVQPWLKKFDEWENSGANTSITPVEQPKEDKTILPLKNEEENIPIPLTSVKSPTQPAESIRFNNLGQPLDMKGPFSTPPPTQPAPPPSMTPAPASVPPNDGSEFKSEQLAQEFWGQKKSHVVFMNSLEKLSNQDPRILAAYISKYAKSIKLNDPETAIELFNIVKKMKG